MGEADSALGIEVMRPTVLFGDHRKSGALKGTESPKITASHLFLHRCSRRFVNEVLR